MVKVVMIVLSSVIVFTGLWWFFSRMSASGDLSFGVSADGRVIALTTGRDIQVIHEDDPAKNKTLDIGADIASLDVSPDGSMVAFSYRDHVHGFRIGVADITTGAWHPVTGYGRRGLIPSDFSPTWSHDGTHIAFSRSFGTSGDLFGGTNITDFDLYTVNVSTSKETRLTHNAYYRMSKPAFAPGDDLIAFAGGGFTERAIIIVNTKSGDVRSVGKPGGSPVFGPGKDRIFCSWLTDSTGRFNYDVASITLKSGEVDVWDLFELRIWGLRYVAGRNSLYLVEELASSNRIVRVDIETREIREIWPGGS